MTPRQLVLIEWHDAQDNKETWANEDELELWSNSPCIILSVGFLVSKTDKYHTIAADWDDDDKNYGRITKIPSGMVVSIKELKHESL